MALELNRYIASIRSKPGQNWHSLAFQAIQDWANSLVIPAATTTKTTTTIGGGGASATSSAPSTPFNLYVNGTLSAHNSANLNNALPSPPAGMASVEWLIDNTLPLPNISGNVSLMGGANVQSGTSYAIDATDNGKLVVLTSSSAVSVTLQVATSLSSKFFFAIEAQGSGGAMLTPTTSLIDGAGSLALTQNQGVLVFSDGTNYWTERGTGTGGGGSPNFADNETPTDSGDHQHFILAHTPSPAASLLLFLNGLLQFVGAGNDYTLSGANIAMASAISGTFTMLASYRY